MIIIITTNEHPDRNVLDKFANACHSPSSWHHISVGQGDDNLIDNHEDEFAHIMHVKVLEAIERLKQKARS